jgi:hypothetical protein
LVSEVLIYLSVALWIVLGTIHTTTSDLLTAGLRSYILTGLGTLTICALMVQLAGRVIRGQHRAAATILEAINAAPCVANPRGTPTVLPATPPGPRCTS